MFAFAVIADAVMPDANLAITVPFADGVITPSITAIFEVTAADDAFDADGSPKADSPSFSVRLVAVKLYSDRYAKLVTVGQFIDHRDPVVVAAAENTMKNRNL